MEIYICGISLQSSYVSFLIPTAKLPSYLVEPVRIWSNSEALEISAIVITNSEQSAAISHAQAYNWTEVRERLIVQNQITEKVLEPSG